MGPSKKILIADDEVIILKILKEELTDAGYAVDMAHDGEEASVKLRYAIYDLVILDQKMPKKSGLDVLKEIREQAPETIVILMTAFGSIHNAVEAMKLGAFDYLTKPFENADLLKKVAEAFKIKAGIQVRPLGEDEDVRLIGSSPALVDIRRKIDKIKDLEATVLLTGESGTGKGVIAKEIHRSSHRYKAPFVHVNCAALPPTLIESELFGYEKGAFTGATDAKPGRFESAAEGMIFLDEIGALDPALQAKLLTVLQEKHFERLGGSKVIPLKARVLAATNDNLEEAVRQKRFREDLYYRLNVISIECPPLRYRKEDIEALTRHFVEKMNLRMHKCVQGIDSEITALFLTYNWPGNIRELENTVESAIALSTGTTLSLEDLPLRIRQHALELGPKGAREAHSLLEIEEIKAIRCALERNGGHRQRTAEELGISRRTLQYKLKKFDLLS